MPHSSRERHAMMRKVRPLVTLSIIVVGLSLAAPSSAQRVGRRVVTLDLLEEHPHFFHGENVIVQSDAMAKGVLTYLVDDEHRMLVIDVAPPPTGVRERLEIIGRFYDVGRLEPEDQRAVEQPFERLARFLLNKPWPGVGELKILVAESSRPVNEPDRVTLRTVALNPKAHHNEGVTLIGRFRGRNLYGDLPDSPGESRYDFVLTSSDAAIWVVGKEPKGNNFKLDVRARIDTGRWLEVTGRIHVHEGMVILDAGAIRLAEPAANRITPPQGGLQQGLVPEVIFSTPIENDTDIPTDGTVRIQFSRDMSEDSFEGRVRVSYPTLAGDATLGELPPVPFTTEYHALNRVLEIRFAEPLVAFQTVSVEILDGVITKDGATLAPWSLSFFVGR